MLSLSWFPPLNLFLVMGLYSQLTETVSCCLSFKYLTDFKRELLLAEVLVADMHLVIEVLDYVEKILLYLQLKQKILTCILSIYLIRIYISNSYLCMYVNYNRVYKSSLHFEFTQLSRIYINMQV